MKRCAMTISGDRVHQALSGYCLLPVLLRLKIRQILFRGILILPAIVEFQE